MRRSTFLIVCGAVWLLGVDSSLVASDSTYVSKGARVRVSAPSLDAEPVIGEVTSITETQLVVLPTESETPVSISTSAIETIEVSAGKKKKVARGVLIGGGIGAAVGFGLGAAFYEEDCGSGSYDFGCIDSGSELLTVGLLNTGFGALLGWAFAGHTEKWNTAQLAPEPPVTVHVRRDGSVRLAFSLTL